MKFLIAKQRCNSCGFEFDIMYFEDGSYEYIEGQEPCECEDSFSPCEGVPSISQWLEQIKDNKFCKRCGCQVEVENELDYPYYCPNCDENMYSFEVTD